MAERSRHLLSQRFPRFVFDDLTSTVNLNSDLRYRFRYHAADLHTANVTKISAHLVPVEHGFQLDFMTPTDHAGLVA